MSDPRQRAHALLQPRAVEDLGFRAQARAGSPGVAEVYLYDEIGYFGVTAAAFQRALRSLPEDTTEIQMHVNSPGGDVYDGIAILNSLRQHPARVVVTVDGLAASAASFIAMAGDEVVMARNSEMMIHSAWALVVGNAVDLRETADRLDKIGDNLASIYAEKAGGDVADWQSVMRAETWYSAEEAVEAGLADRVLEKAPSSEDAKARFDLSIFAYAGRAQAPTPPGVSPTRTTPAATAVGYRQEGTAVVIDEQLSALRKLAGTAQDADFDTVLAALGEALEERADSAPVPPGTTLVAEDVLAKLQAEAALGVAAHARQVADDRAAAVDAAVADGRLTPSVRDAWVARLEAGTASASDLDALPKGLVPTAALGHAGGIEVADDDDSFYDRIFEGR